jgi:hypothetical protein
MIICLEIPVANFINIYEFWESHSIILFRFFSRLLKKDVRTWIIKCSFFPWVSSPADMSFSYYCYWFLFYFSLFHFFKIKDLTPKKKLFPAARTRQVVERRINQRFDYHLCSHRKGTNDKNRNCSRNVGLFAFQHMPLITACESFVVIGRHESFRYTT